MFVVLVAFIALVSGFFIGNIHGWHSHEKVMTVSGLD